MRLSAILVYCLTCTGVSLAERPLVNAERQRAVAEVQLAELQLTHAREVRMATKQLRVNGFASRRELDWSQQQLIEAEIDRERHGRLLEMLSDIRTSPEAPASEDQWMIVELPALNELPAEFRLSLLVPVTPHEAVTPHKVDVDAPHRVEQSARIDAVRELRDRIAALSEENSRELRAAERNLQMEQLRRAAIVPEMPIWISRSRSPVQVFGTTVTTDHGLLSLLDRERSRLALTADLRKSEAKLALLRNDAARLAAVDSMRNSELHHSEVVVRQAQREVNGLRQQLTRLLSPPASAVTVSTESAVEEKCRKLFGRTLSRRDLQQIRTLVHERLRQVIDEKRYTANELSRSHDRLQRVTALAERDTWFAGECAFLRLTTTVADARLREVSRRLTQHQLAFEFLERLAAGDDHWKQSLQTLLDTSASRDTTEKLLQSELAIEEFQLAGLRKLSSAGHASWKELTAAKVRVAELQAAIRRGQTIAKLYAEALPEIDSFLKSFDNAVTVAVSEN